MLSIRSIMLAAALLVIGANSQIYYNIDPTTVDPSTRQSWCTTQVSSCPLLCLQTAGGSSTTIPNDCDAKTLNFECICSNGLSPNASEFSQTVPYFACVEFGERCVKACAGQSLCQSDCRKNNPCGAQDPKRVNVTTTSSTQSATATGAQGTNVVYSGLGSDAQPTETTATSPSTSSTPKSGAQAMLDLGRSYGLAVVFTGIFAGFALVM